MAMSGADSVIAGKQMFASQTEPNDGLKDCDPVSHKGEKAVVPTTLVGLR
jgi:hypothetical protein